MSDKQAASHRVHAIDFTKGMLVLLMIVYHVLNYLDFGSLPNEYLGFVPPSFIMITGFLAFNAYAGRPERTALESIVRLGTRALKLVLLFTVLNLAARVLLTHDRYGTSLSLTKFFTDWRQIYLTGEVPGVAYDILLPIAYVLGLAALLVVVPASRWPLLRFVAVVLFALCTVLAAFGLSSNTLNFVGAGILGIASGTLGLAAVDRLAASRVIVVVGLSIYIAAIAFDLDDYPWQIAITVAWLLALYALGAVTRPEHRLPAKIALAGRYSLFAYIIQIVYLQGTMILSTDTYASPARLSIALSGVIALLTWLTIEFVEYARSRNRAVDSAYKSVFG